MKIDDKVLTMAMIEGSLQGMMPDESGEPDASKDVHQLYNNTLFMILCRHIESAKGIDQWKVAAILHTGFRYGVKYAELILEKEKANENNHS
jgi:hypothetical protein